MQDFHLKIGDEVRFAKTVGEADVYLFAGITGDFSTNHVNDQVMQGTRYGKRIAHGALMVGFMSTASTMMTERHARGVTGETPVSLGYDRIRFLGPVYFGDTITVTYRITGTDPVRRRTDADIQVTNQRGETVAVAQHILKWVKDPDAPGA